MKEQSTLAAAPVLSELRERMRAVQAKLDALRGRL
jgi:hypothetical protein